MLYSEEVNLEILLWFNAKPVVNFFNGFFLKIDVYIFFLSEMAANGVKYW